MVIKINIAIENKSLLTIFYAADVLSGFVLFLECTIMGWEIPFAAPESMIISSIFSSLGKSNIVFNNIFSSIDLNPLAPVFFFNCFICYFFNCMIFEN